uniref:AlNc14C167G7923 protein n=1 Tax=Albugo laibachii Nc14 TaxID=890382 RepID=F0WN91_9STRA|nr:AlNc14C167G7923 [Albugo laibachii Nc14]|eukprot:CCA22780.1 AlNc14C167G7923 [Albugo laibachii Nc14]
MPEIDLMPPVIDSVFLIQYFVQFLAILNLKCKGRQWWIELCKRKKNISTARTLD